MIEKDVQKRILQAILINGGKANTNQVIEYTKLSRTSVHHGARHLQSRALITKKTTKNKVKGGYELSVLTLNQKLLQKIKRLISEIGQDVK